MSTAGASGATPAVRDFGPTLPALLRRCFGVRERVTIAVAVVLVCGATAAVLAALLTGPKQLVYRAGPTFNLQYEADLLHRVAPRGEELVRLEAHRGPLSASLTVAPLRLPPYPGNVTSGLMPVYADRFERALSSSIPGYVSHDEGSARVNDAQGYQIGFSSGAAGHFTWGRDMLLVPRDEDVTEGVLLRLRQTKTGPFTKHDNGFLERVRRAFKSFNFGTDRGKW